MENKVINIFKKFANKFPQYYKIRNPGFLLMARYYFRKPTFKYLWFLFYKDPIRIIFNFLIYALPVIIREFIKKILKKDYKNFYNDISKEKVIEYFSKGQGFITISYCQKPFFCPDGRFSNKCSAVYKKCEECFLSEIRRKANKLGIDYYIVLGDYDSVWNILKNQFIKRKKGAYILTVCNMVLNVIKYLSPVFGFRGYILPFVKGECKTLAAYELSEFGYKNVITDISEQSKAILLEILDKSIEQKTRKIKKEEGEIYENKIFEKFEIAK